MTSEWQTIRILSKFKFKKIENDKHGYWKFQVAS